ncbi:MAG: ATP-binding cassette domain-containing protein [Verrucomicrobiales bacterium]|nr:ATP-binding cassette domain-containing protein [Verrucomicrobiales bacterium]
MSTIDSYLLRWRNRQIGPVTLAGIEQMLADQEIGMWHEVHFRDEWMPLNRFFVEVHKASLAQPPAPAAPRRPVSPVAAATARAVAAAAFESTESRVRAGRIVAKGLTKTVFSKSAGGRTLRILQDVSLAIEPGEFVALLGPSGSGKSTLMDALNGRRPATRGTVRCGGVDLYRQFERVRSSIGYVPQKDIIHQSLTVNQELRFAARLRLPPGTGPDEIEEVVESVVAKLGLQERTTTRNSSLSGGQFKRVSLGVELLADPKYLFLDEATSGQDAATEARMMTLFRKLACEGKTVICITHNLENVGLCDQVALMMSGRLVYFGPPNSLLEYFGVEKPSDVYGALEKRPAEEWAEKFKGSDLRETYVVSRLKAEEAANREYAGAPDREGAAAKPGFFRQLGILTQRYSTVMLQDRRNVMLLLAQAPIIGMLIAMVFRKVAADKEIIKSSYALSQILFLMGISAIWFGCINAAKEIVKELPIYLRERAVHLSLPAYFASKMAVMAVLCAFQCLVLYGSLAGLVDLNVDVPRTLGMLGATSMCGVALGLCVSAMVSNSDKAMAIVPILLIPQVVFAGAIQELTGVAKVIGSWLVVAYWSFDGLLHTLSTEARDALVIKTKYSFADDLSAVGAFFFVLSLITLIALKVRDSLK